MELADETKLADRTALFRIWFEYLKLARTIAALGKLPYQAKSDAKFIATLKKALDKSSKHYALWDLDKDQTYRAWWKGHLHLFEEKYVVRELKHGELPSDPEALVIEVPLRFSAAILATRTQQLISAASARLGVDAKSKKRPTAKFAISEGAEPRLDALKEMLVIYRDVYLPNLRGKLVEKQTQALKGIDFLKAVNDFYANRKNKSWGKVPTALIARYKTDKNHKETAYLDPDANQNALRSLRRYIQKAERVLLNVAGGEFPGIY